LFDEVLGLESDWHGARLPCARSNA
jgi:hypothetical protein